MQYTVSNTDSQRIEAFHFCQESVSIWAGDQFLGLVYSLQLEKARYYVSMYSAQRSNLG